MKLLDRYSFRTQVVAFFTISIILFSVSGCESSVPRGFTLLDTQKKYQRLIDNALNNGKLSEAENLLKDFKRDIDFFVNISRFFKKWVSSTKIQQARNVFSELEKKIKRVRPLIHLETLEKQGNYKQALSFIEVAINSSNLDNEIYEKLENIKKRIQELISKIPPKVLGLEFVRVSKHVYSFGTPKNEPGRDPILEVEPQSQLVKEFFISTTEVTQECYAHYSGNLVSQHHKRRPVYNVSFEMARKFCGILSQQNSDYKFSLPNEIEWEISCRAGQPPENGPVNAPKLQERFKGSLDRAKQTLQRYAIFKRNNSGLPIPDEVKQKEGNAWGLYDMHGNVAEWCERVSGFKDWYSNQLGKQPIRGGSFLSSYERCRAGSRSLELEGTKSPSIGFRIIARRRY